GGKKHAIHVCKRARHGADAEYERENGGDRENRRALQRSQRVAERDHRANGFGRSWKWITLLVVPLPVSMWKGARVLTVAQRPRPFQPPLGSSIRPSIHLVKNPVGYGTRRTTHWPSLNASRPSAALPVLMGTFAPRPSALN